MTRIDSARAAANSAKESVRYAAEAAAPYATTARDTASHYAQEAGARLGPVVSTAATRAADTARVNYDAYVVPQMVKARTKLPPEVDAAAVKALKKSRKATAQATAYARPRVETAYHDARTAAGPARDEAMARGTAAWAALRGEVTPREIEKLVRKRSRRSATGRFVKRLGLVGLLAGAGYAAWRWWDKQANPDWLVEPPAATEVADERGASAATGGAFLAPDVEAKQADTDGGHGTDNGSGSSGGGKKA